MFKFPVEALVRLNDLSENVSITKRSSLKVLFILAGIEGHCHIFTDLAESFSNSNTLVYGLEYTLDVPYTSIKDSARFYLEIIHKKLNQLGAKTFNLAGYSYGSISFIETSDLNIFKTLAFFKGGIIAIEIARQLEMSEYMLASNLQNLILFESSHAFFRAAVHSNSISLGQRIPNKDIFGRSRIYTAPLSMYLSRIIGHPQLKLEIYNKLRDTCKGVDDAIKKALNYVTDKGLIAIESDNDYEELYQFLKVHLFKSNAAFMYEFSPEHQLNSPLVLMRSEHFIYKRMDDLYIRSDYDSEELAKMEFDTNTYDLDKICSNLQVLVFKKGNHYSFIPENSDDIVLFINQLFNKKSKL